MPSLKKITHTLSHLILAGNTIAANHIPISNIELGNKIYHKHCKACHGGRGDGKTFSANVLFPKPKNFIAKTTKEELTREQMIRSVTKGRAKTAMMPWGSVLTEQEIHSVVSYIRKELMKLKE